MEKREWDGKGEENEPEQKRKRIPALASVIVEALKVDCMQKLCSSLEPILRRVVSEEVERAIAKLGPARVGARSSPNRLEGPDVQKLQLHFRTRLSLPLFTGGKVEGEQGAAIHVVLLDASNGQVVTSGSESSAKLDVLVLDGDFSKEDDDSWTEEEFERYILKEREMKGPILTGQLQLSLKDGVGTLGDLTFMDNSSWTRSRKFRLGLRVNPGYSEGVRIREAKTEAFLVKDHRGESYKKHHPPAQKDEVWRLEKIAKDGSYHKKLNNAGIHTVEDFLRMALRDPLQLRRILGSGMSNKMWGILVDHAKTCVLSGKLYVYYDMQDVGAIFNNDYEFCGLIASGRYISADNLSDTQKVFADSLVKKAYDNWNRVVKYDGEVLLSSKGDGGASSSMAGVGTSSINITYDEQVSLPHLTCTQTDSGFALGGSAGYDDQSTGASFHSQYAAAEAHQLNSIPCASQDQFIGSSQLPSITRNNSTSLAVAPSLQTTLEFGLHDMPPQTSNLNSYDWQPQDNRAVDDMFSEEIRMRSHQMLEHEDMQQLLRAFTTGGVSANLAEDSFAFESYMQTPLPTDDQGRSGKAVVGWLKIKAAMRWGIFIRKKAAERRAQIVELDD